MTGWKIHHKSRFDCRRVMGDDVGYYGIQGDIKRTIWWIPVLLENVLHPDVWIFQWESAPSSHSHWAVFISFFNMSQQAIQQPLRLIWKVIPNMWCFLLVLAMSFLLFYFSPLLKKSAWLGWFGSTWLPSIDYISNPSPRPRRWSNHNPYRCIQINWPSLSPTVGFES